MRIVPALLVTTLTLPSAAQAFCAADAMVVFDGSASMAEIGFDVSEATRIEEARLAMAEIAPQVAPLRRIGLLTYGPGGADSCSGINLRFPPQDAAAARLVADVEALDPAGLTPLTASVRAAAEVLDHRATPAVIVLITDGNETCGGSPCALAAELRAEAVDLTVHVLGFKVVFDFFAWNNPDQKNFFGGEVVARCLADQTGGEYASTETVDELIAALQRTLGCPLFGALPEPRARG